MFINEEVLPQSFFCFEVRLANYPIPERKPMRLKPASLNNIDENAAVEVFSSTKMMA
jgi:hypothetical protein